MTTSPRTAALVTPLLGIALVLIVALVVVLIAQRPTAEIAVAATAPTLSPAEALAYDRPIVLFVYPVESCQQRYCLQPRMIADRIGTEFGDAVSFVPIRSHATADPTDPTATTLEGWDLYLLPPYDAWLPDLQIDAGGYALSTPTLVLIDRDRQVVARSTNSAEIVASLHALVGAPR